MKLNDEGQESILQEAHRLTHGDRNSSYGHPYDDYSCTAALASAILEPILARPITAHEMALIMCCVKLSRESRVPKRDNLVDLAGYAWVARMCHEESERRNEIKGCGCNAVVTCAKHAPPVVLSTEPVPACEPPHVYGSKCWCGWEHRLQTGGLAPVPSGDTAYASSRADELAPRERTEAGCGCAPGTVLCPH